MSTTPQTITSDFNLEKLNTEQLEQHISASIEACSNLAVFGYRGSGKSMIAKQCIKAANHHLAYMSLSMYDKTDIAGYPELMSQREKGDVKERFVTYMLPRVFEPMINGDKPVVLLLDEVDKAEKELWAPLFDIVQDKSIGGRPLKNLRSCIMTGNLISEGGQKPSPPLLDRTEAYLVETSALYWLKWAASVPTEIHSSIYAFISDHTGSLHTASNMEENYKSASPRGWHLASRLLFIGEQKGWDVNLLIQKIAGQVGKKEALNYRIYYQNYKTLLPMVDKVFVDKNWEDDWKGLTPTEKLYASTIICSRFALQLDATTLANPPDSIRTVGKFMQKCGYENLTMGVRSQIRPKRILAYNLMENPHWNGILAEVSQSLEKAGK